MLTVTALFAPALLSKRHIKETNHSLDSHPQKMVHCSVLLFLNPHTAPGWLLGAGIVPALQLNREGCQQTRRYSEVRESGAW